MNKNKRIEITIFIVVTMRRIIRIQIIRVRFTMINIEGAIISIQNIMRRRSRILRMMTKHIKKGKNNVNQDHNRRRRIRHIKGASKGT